MERKNKLQSIKYKTRIRDEKENSADCMCFKRARAGDRRGDVQYTSEETPLAPHPPTPASLRMK